LLSESIYSEASKEYTHFRIASKASKEMLAILDMKKQLKGSFDFKYLQHCLQTIVNSQANHNKHLVYLLNRQLTKNRLTYLWSQENKQLIERLTEKYESSQNRLYTIQEELDKREQ
jgi:chromosome segregation ATPase